MDSTQFLGMLIPSLLSIGSLVVMLRKLNGVAEIRTIQPQPLRTAEDPKLITKEDCEKQHNAERRFLDAQFESIKDQLCNLVESLDRRNQEGELRASGIHKRIDLVAKELANVDGRLNEHIAHGRHQ